MLADAVVEVPEHGLDEEAVELGAELGETRLDVEKALDDDDGDPEVGSEHLVDVEAKDVGVEFTYLAVAITSLDVLLFKNTLLLVVTALVDRLLAVLVYGSTVALVDRSLVVMITDLVIVLIGNSVVVVVDTSVPLLVGEAVPMAVERRQVV